jgi:hypothetical protein
MHDQEDMDKPLDRLPKVKWSGVRVLLHHRFRAGANGFVKVHEQEPIA